MAEFEEREEFVEDSEEEEYEEAEPAAPQPKGGRGAAGRRFGRRPRVCAFCAEHITYIDYKKVDVLRRYITERGQIRPRRKTGLCSKHQRSMGIAVKRARHLALLPFTGEQVRLASQNRG